jgi:hypothetical protein
LIPNLVDWMTGSDELLALRSRSARTRKLDEVGSDTARGIKTANIVGPALLVLLSGLVVFVVRRNRK